MNADSGTEAGGVVGEVMAEPLSPTNEAMFEAGKTMLVESISVGREFCKSMITTAFTAIPVYMAIIGLIIPEGHKFSVVEGILAVSPVAVFLVAALVSLKGYSPQHGTTVLDYPAEIEDERSRTIQFRKKWGRIGFAVFILAVVASLIVFVWLLVTMGHGGTTTAPGDPTTRPPAP